MPSLLPSDAPTRGPLAQLEKAQLHLSLDEPPGTLDWIPEFLIQLRSATWPWPRRLHVSATSVKVVAALASILLSQLSSGLIIASILFFHLFRVWITYPIRTAPACFQVPTCQSTSTSCLRFHRLCRMSRPSPRSGSDPPGRQFGISVLPSSPRWACRRMDSRIPDGRFEAVHHRHLAVHQLPDPRPLPRTFSTAARAPSC